MDLSKQVDSLVRQAKGLNSSAQSAVKTADTIAYDAENARAQAEDEKQSPRLVSLLAATVDDARAAGEAARALTEKTEALLKQAEQAQKEM